MAADGREKLRFNVDTNYFCGFAPRLDKTIIQSATAANSGLITPNAPRGKQLENDLWNNFNDPVSWSK